MAVWRRARLPVRPIPPRTRRGLIVGLQGPASGCPHRPSRCGQLSGKRVRCGCLTAYARAGSGSNLHTSPAGVANCRARGSGPLAPGEWCVFGSIPPRPARRANCRRKGLGANARVCVCGVHVCVSGVPVCVSGVPVCASKTLFCACGALRRPGAVGWCGHTPWRVELVGQKGQCGGPHGVRAGRSAVPTFTPAKPVWPIVGQQGSDHFLSAAYARRADWLWVKGYSGKGRELRDGICRRRTDGLTD